MILLFIHSVIQSIIHSFILSFTHTFVFPNTGQYSVLWVLYQRFLCGGRVWWKKFTNRQLNLPELPKPSNQKAIFYNEAKLV